MSEESTSSNSISQTNRRIPLGWKIFLILIAYSIIGGTLQSIAGLLAGVPLATLSEDFSSIPLQVLFIMQLFGFLGLAFVIYYFRVKLDKMPIYTMGFSIKNRYFDIAAGFFFAWSIIGLGFLILYFSRLIIIEDIRLNIYDFLYGIGIFLIVSLTEEILFRGYILNNLMKVLNKYYSLLISAAIFAIIHLFNPNLAIIPVINLFLAGILLGATYIYTKNLWFPISLHFFWNFLQGPVFGFSVSGINFKSIIDISFLGNEYFHGGNFGYEGSILCTLLLIIAIIIIYYYYTKNPELNISNDVKEKCNSIVDNNDELKDN